MLSQQSNKLGRSGAHLSKPEARTYVAVLAKAPVKLERSAEAKRSRSRNLQQIGQSKAQKHSPKPIPLWWLPESARLLGKALVAKPKLLRMAKFHTWNRLFQKL
jgi:hypothetical protein